MGGRAGGGLSGGIVGRRVGKQGEDDRGEGGDIGRGKERWSCADLAPRRR